MVQYRNCFANLNKNKNYKNKTMTCTKLKTASPYGRGLIGLSLKFPSEPLFEHGWTYRVFIDPFTTRKTKQEYQSSERQFIQKTPGELCNPLLRIYTGFSQMKDRMYPVAILNIIFLTTFSIEKYIFRQGDYIWRCTCFSLHLVIYSDIF